MLIMWLMLAVLAVLFIVFRGQVREDVRARPVSDHGEATRERVALAGPRHCDQFVTGTGHRQDALARVAQDHDGKRWFHLPAQLRPEPDNPHDRNAVAVDMGGRHIGYLPREDAPEYLNALRLLTGGAPVADCRGYIHWDPDHGYTARVSYTLPLARDASGGRDFAG